MHRGNADLEAPLGPWERLFFKEFFLRSWWVILFIIICLFTNARVHERTAAVKAKLEQRWQLLSKEKEEETMKREELLLHIDSQKDAQWVELTLMKSFGLVPEGSVKIVFQEAMQ
jgi:hypothetical protein